MNPSKLVDAHFQTLVDTNFKFTSFHVVSSVKLINITRKGERKGRKYYGFIIIFLLIVWLENEWETKRQPLEKEKAPAISCFAGEADD